MNTEKENTWLWKKKYSNDPTFRTWLYYNMYHSWNCFLYLVYYNLKNIFVTLKKFEIKID